MQITLTNTGKRYNREWIFRHVDYEFRTTGTYAITGSNGSGKSTLLQVIAGAVMASEGSIIYSREDDLLRGNSAEATLWIKTDEPYKYLSVAAPYLELIEEMTAMEQLRFHTTFKPFKKPFQEMLHEMNLHQSADKQIRYFSSGMKQRLKLAMAFFSTSPVLLLDEPTTNLDKDGLELYRRLISDYSSDRLVIISSNDLQEYDFCENVIPLSQYK